MSEDEFELPEPPVADGGEIGGALGQSDIDALFGDMSAPPPARSGLRALVDCDTRHERLPMLEVICDRVLRSFATSMRSLTSDAIDVRLDDVASGRFGDLMNHTPLPAMFGVFRVAEWNDFGVIVVEPGLIYPVVDALLGGGKGGERQQRIEGRAFTSIETALVGRMMGQALGDLAAAFAVVAPVTMTVERIETSPRFAAIADPNTATAVCTFGVEMDGRGGRFTVLLPHTTMEPVRDKLQQRFIGARPGADNGWDAQLERELRRTPVELTAVLSDQSLPLQSVRQWAVGDVIRLAVGPDDPVTLSCGGRNLAAGLTGRHNGQAAVRLLSNGEGSRA